VPRSVPPPPPPRLLPHLSPTPTSLKEVSEAGLQLQGINKRKQDLARLAANKDCKALKDHPAPKPTIFLTASHLVEQAADDLASFSNLFNVWLTIHISGTCTPAYSTGTPASSN